jgi:hypothetical protein
MRQIGFECFRCKQWAARSPDNAKLDGDECICERPLHPTVVHRRQREAGINAVIFGGAAFLALSLAHISGAVLWCLAASVMLVAYVFYLWLFGRQLRRERTSQ